MKQVFWALALMFSFWLQPMAHAGSAQVEATTTGAVKLHLIQQLEADGYLSGKLADDARKQYVTPEDLATLTTAKSDASGPSFWARVMTWTNFFYVLGVLVLLVAFGGWIARIAALFIHIIVAVPKELYQVVFLSAGSAMALNAVLPLASGLAASHSFYLALFGSIANLIVLGWVLESHPNLAKALRSLFSLGLPLGSIASLWLLVYFVGLALCYESEIFGFMAAVAFSGMLTFTIGYRPGVLWLDFEEKALPAVVFGNLAALLIYTSLKLTGHLPAEAALFEVGLTYYCSIALGVGFLVGASPFKWRSASPVGYLVLFFLAALSSVYAYVFYDFKVIGSIMCVFGVLLALEWHAKLCMKAGFVGGMFLLGVALVGLSMAMEKYGYLLILRTIS